MRTVLPKPLLALALSLVVVPALAQAPADPNEPDAAQENAAVEGPADAAAPAGSPLDYEASEQISEDLSVSFPVDI